MRRGGLQHPVADRVVGVCQRRQARGQPAPLRHHCGDDQRVVLDDVAGLQRAARRDQFRAGRLDGDARAAAHVEPHVARACGRADVLGPQRVVGGQDQLGRNHVLTHRPDVLPRRDRRENLDLRAVCRVHRLDVLDHDDCIGAGGQGVAGVDIERTAVVLGAADGQPEGLRLAGAARVLRGDGIAVHRGRVIVGRGNARPDGLRGDPAGRSLQRDPLAGQGGCQPGRVQRSPPAGQRLGQGDIFEIG